MSDNKIPGVDYAALGRVLRRAKADGYGLRKGSDDWVVPVIAAYREQMRARGVVEVPIPLLEFAINYAINVPERDELIAIMNQED